MTRVSIPWGKEGSVDFDLPSGWDLREVLEPRVPESPLPVESQVDEAMDKPIGLPPLSEFARGKASAAIVVDDRTRPTPVARMMPRVIRELEAAGVPDDKIKLLMALGTHRPMTDEEIEERVGTEAFRRFKYINHDCHDKSRLQFMGRTPTRGIPFSVNRAAAEAEVVVLIGCIESHEMAGVGGGYKNVMPGVAGFEAILATHNRKFQRPTRVSNGGMPWESCVFRRTLDECGELLGPKTFILNAVTLGDAVEAIVAGHPRKAHDAGRAAYVKMTEVRLDRGPADVVIAGASPLDVDLRVTMKSLFNAAAALKKGGLLISVSATPEGLGDLRLPKSLPSGAKKVVKKIPMGLLEPVALRVNPSPDQAHGTLSLVTMLRDFRAILMLNSSGKMAPALAGMGIEFFDQAGPLLDRAAEIMPSAEVVVLPHAGASFIAWDS